MEESKNEGENRINLANETGASTDSDDDAKIIVQDLLECPICCLPFSRPLQLSCGHSYCANCVDRMVETVTRPGQPHILYGLQWDQDLARALINSQNRISHGIPSFASPLHIPNNNNNNDNSNGSNLRLQSGLGGLADVHLEQNHMPLGRRSSVNENMFGDYVYDMTDQETSRRIRCPECRKYTVVPRDGLPINYRLQEMINRCIVAHEHKKKETMLASTCSACKDKLKAGIFFYCESCCSNLLCSLCALRFHNGHKIVERRGLSKEERQKGKDKVNEYAASSTFSFDTVYNMLKESYDDNYKQLKSSFDLCFRPFYLLSGNVDCTAAINSEAELEETVEKARVLATKFQSVVGSMEELIKDQTANVKAVCDELQQFMRIKKISLTRLKNATDERMKNSTGSPCIKKRRIEVRRGFPSSSTLPPQQDQQPLRLRRMSPPDTETVLNPLILQTHRLQLTARRNRHTDNGEDSSSPRSDEALASGSSVEHPWDEDEDITILEALDRSSSRS
ncbi:unnamed protein product [Auanema sp. JU1783]|nr:unnamed protein product [Auanema sp. JU1783]